MRLLLAAALVLLSACSRSGYPDGYRENFLSACTAQGAPSAVCECSWERASEEITFAEMTEMEQAIGAGQEHPAKDKLLQISDFCRAQAGLPIPPRSDEVNVETP